MSYYSDDWLTILLGDCRAVMAAMEPESVQSVVTSPPYWGLRDYGTEGQLGLEPTPEAYVAAMVEVFREVRRVLRSDGTVWLNLGDSYASSPPGRGPQPGVSGLAGINSPTYQATLAAGHSTHAGTLDGARAIGLKAKDLIGIPWRVAFALQADGWYLRSDIIWSKPNPMPESVTDRPTKSHEYLFLLAKSPRYYFDADAVREPHTTPDGMGWAANGKGERYSTSDYGDHRGAADFSRKDGLQAMGGHPNGRNIRSVWTVATQPYPGAHFATFPSKLIEPCIKAGCPTGGWVLDPFAGSGTTGLVANRLGRRAVLIDLNADYLGQVMERAVEGVPYPLGLETA